MERTNNFPCQLQLLIEPGGPLEGTVNEDFRETVCLSGNTGERELDVQGKRQRTYNLMGDDRPLAERRSDFNGRPCSSRDLAK